MIKEGKGWRIGWKSEQTIYQGLLGGDDWAVELTLAEMEDFCRLLPEINQTVQDISHYLMDEEKIVCEVESELLWLGAEGFPDNYSLRVILSQGRGCEGTWPPETVPHLLQAIQSFHIF